MPVVSKAQGAFLGIHRPDILRKWKVEGADTSVKDKPYRLKKLKTPRRRVIP